MAEHLRILILEDNPTDAELIQFELEEAMLVFTARVVMTEKDYVREIQDFCPDIILSDYDLPTYNGSLALAEARRRCPDTPFILVTGAIVEDRAIEILTQGAKDYVLKTRLQQRLAPAVRRALAEAEEHKERKKAEQELRAASLYSRTLIEANLDPLVTISSEGKVMDVNKATEDIMGVPRERIIGSDFSDYFTEPEKARAGYKKVFSQGSVRDYPLAIRHITGHVTDVLYNVTTYKNEKGEIQGVFAVARDVTELKKAEEQIREAYRTLDEQVKLRTAELEAEAAVRKRTEEELRERESVLRAFFDSPGLLRGIVEVADGNIRCVSVNKAAAAAYGLTPEAVCGRLISELGTPPDIVQLYLEHGEESRRSGLDVSFEIFRRLADGGKWLLVTASCLGTGPAGTPRFAFVMRDITERKQAELALKEQTRKLEDANKKMEISRRFLEIANKCTDLKRLLHEFADEIQKTAACEAVGIRLLDEDGNIPYLAYRGFSRQFYEEESPLSIKTDQCMCINVVKGTTDPALPFYTEGGSFYMNGTTRFLATVSEEDKGQTRNVCNQTGYESVALIPIRLNSHILGLIHLADRRENMVPRETVETLEQVAAVLGVGVQRALAEEELRRQREQAEKTLRRNQVR